MRAFLIGFLLGVIIGGGGLWFLQHEKSGELVTTTEQAATAARDVKKLIDAKLEVLELQADRIQKEMSEKGRVVRRKASELGERVADAAADVRTTTVIKAKLASDADLSALAISVSTTDGVVTLSGKVAEPELVGKAMLLALETEGVSQVVSTLQVSRE